ncbi:Retrovirus-related Pol polyprotein from transposon opus [Mycena venus]|uniref:Retrovirus-related Pol polyprotein from transposon opus n=1 Tax=Mycena venus TaxID=2733690 RepID=A0A8H6YQE8_9AGAR|nr:Retrovirus-related Pol polyprotein from transposon opus [Mycena venus]
MSNNLMDAQEEWLERTPAAKATFMAWTLQEALENERSAFAMTRSQKKMGEVIVPPVAEAPVETGGGIGAKLEGSEIGARLEDSESQAKVEEDELDVLEPTAEYWGAVNPPPNIHIGMDDAYRKSWVEAYQKDNEFKRLWADPDVAKGRWKPGQRFFRSDGDLLFFRDADYQPRLCVPETKRKEVLVEAHEAPLESAHVSPERLWSKISSKFYWRRMKLDIEDFASTCDICQKTKHRNFTRYGYLTPNPIPTRPYESISLDLIVNLPWSGEFNAILVVVDRLTKHASFIPTTSGLTAQGFADLFVSHTVSRFGLPDSIIADRDPRWTSDFWAAVTAAIKTKMSLSSSHHPQHDGQTENVNRQLETMLRAYVRKDRADWADWLKLMEFAYNSNVHASIGTTPFFLLYGFHPKAPLDFLLPNEPGAAESYGMRKEASAYLEQLHIHRENARLAIARAQHDQAKYYNRGRREVPEFKVGARVLVNPHSLEWVESKGEGAKLVQRWIGPFEVLQKINPRTYRLRLDDRYPGLPVFNLDHLKPYKESPAEFGGRSALPDSRNDRTESEEWEVEKIVGKRYDKRKKQDVWLVRWKGYRPQFDSWQT